MTAAPSRVGSWLLAPPALGRDRALDLTERLGAATHLVSSIEYLLSERDRAPGGLNDYDITRDTVRVRSAALRRVVHAAGDRRATRALHAARVVAAAALLVPTGRRTRLAADAFLAGSQVLLHPRHHQGGDGSDQVAFLVQTTAGLARLGGRRDVTDAALWFLASQSVLSYAVSGWVKLFGAPWRSGTALAGILRTRTYGDEQAWRLVTRFPRTARVAGTGVLAMECLFPVVLVGRGRQLAPLFVGSAAVFHLANARLMGLNRFLTAFVAMHPAVLYVTGPAERPGTGGPLERRDDLMRSALLGVGAASVAAGLVAATRRRRRVLRGRGDEQALTVSSGNVLSFRRTGPAEVPAGTPLLVLEAGLAAPMDYWDWIAAGLSAEYPVLTYDRAGYGRSRYRAGRRYDLDVAVADLTDLVTEQAGDLPVVLIGHSLGGYLVWRAAERLNGRVRAVVAVDASHPKALERSAAQAAGVDAVQSGMNHTRTWTRLGMGTMMTEPVTFRRLRAGTRAAVLDQFRDGRLWAAAEREWAAARRMFAAASDLRPLPVPTLVLTASATAARVPDQLALHQEMAAGPRSEHHVVPLSDHDSLLSGSGPAQRVVALVTRFLRGAAAGAPDRAVPGHDTAEVSRA